MLTSSSVSLTAKWLKLSAGTPTGLELTDLHDKTYIECMQGPAACSQQDSFTTWIIINTFKCFFFLFEVGKQGEFFSVLNLSQRCFCGPAASCLFSPCVSKWFCNQGMEGSLPSHQLWWLRLSWCGFPGGCLIGNEPKMLQPQWSCWRDVRPKPDSLF